MPKRIRRRQFLGGTLVAMTGLTTTRRAARADRFPIAKEGSPAATLVTAVKLTPATALAVRELQHHLERIAGAKLPIRTDADTVTGPRILVGESEATRALGVRGSDFAA